MDAGKGALVAGLLFVWLLLFFCFSVWVEIYVTKVLQKVIQCSSPGVLGDKI